MALDIGGAAGGGIALQEVLRNLAEQAFKNQAAQNDRRRTAIDQQRANDDSELRRATLQSMSEDRAARQQAGLAAEGVRIGGAMAPGTDVTGQPDVIRALSAAGLRPKHTDGTLGSTNLSGAVDTAGAIPRIIGLAQSANPGQGAKDVYGGSFQQQKQASDDADLQRLLADPTVPENVRNFLRIRSAVPGGAVPADLFKPQDADEPVMRLNPRTGKMEQIGTAPKGTHFVNEPPPKDTSTADASRLDRSYQYHATALEKLRKPVEDTAGKLSDLSDELAQGTPQADALVAPKLLSVLVGGQGSGLRLNEAEIARVVGGRSQWQNLQAAAQKWSLNPATANSITPDQRQQIRALISAVSVKNRQALDTLDQAGDALTTATDAGQHKQILNGVHKKLTTITTGGAASGPASKGTTADPLGIR